MSTFGSRLREFRKHKRLSQELFAEKIGATQSNMTQWETDRNKPNAENYKQIGIEFPELNIDWLEKGSGQMLKAGGREKPAIAKDINLRHKVLELIVARKRDQGLLTPEEQDLLDSLDQ